MAPCGRVHRASRECVLSRDGVVVVRTLLPQGFWLWCSAMPIQMGGPRSQHLPGWVGAEQCWGPLVLFLLVGNVAWLWEREKVQQELWGLALFLLFLFSSALSVGVQLSCVTKKCGDSWSDPLLIASSLRSPAVKFPVKVLEPEL